MSSAASPRRSWLQFSLRGLLLAMLFVGVAIVIYRWPWEDQKLETPFQTGLARSELGFDDCEVEFEEGEWKTYFGQPRGYLPLLTPPSPEPPPNLRRITTYRRNWRGAPVKDGPETIQRQDGAVIGQRWYDEGDLRRVTLHQPSGEVLRTESYRGGVANGPFEFHEPVRSLRGQYHLGKKTGEWRYEYQTAGERIRVTQNYADNLPHGAWTWHSGTGQVLQTATFERGHLVNWNGQSWREHLAVWLERHQVDAVTRALLEWMVIQLEISEQSVLSGDDFVVVSRPVKGELPSVLFYSPQRRAGDGYSFFNYKELKMADEITLKRAWEALLPFAMLKSRLPVYRFGTLGFVPVNTREVQWQDPTGVSQIRFAAGSAHQAAWEEPVAGTIPEGIDSDWWFQELFAETPIQIDGSEFNPGPEYGRVFTFAKNPASGEYETVYHDQSAPRHRPTHWRSRRDILGLLLESRGYSCEQRGNMLILLPW